MAIGSGCSFSVHLLLGLNQPQLRPSARNEFGRQELSGVTVGVVTNVFQGECRFAPMKRC